MKREKSVGGIEKEMEEVANGLAEEYYNMYKTNFKEAEIRPFAMFFDTSRFRFGRSFPSYFCYLAAFCRIFRIFPDIFTYFFFFC